MGSSCICHHKKQNNSNSSLSQKNTQMCINLAGKGTKKMNPFFKNKTRTLRSSIYISNREDIHSVYEFQETIGAGYSGKVRKVFLKSNPSKIFVVKSINKDNLSLRQMNNLVKEVKLLSRLDHPNIIKYYETYDDEEEFHIVMTYCTGGELFDYIRNKGNLSEKESIKIIYQIIHGIAHCHSKSIIHRDLKAENILFETPSREIVKIIDFGLSIKSKDDTTLHSLVGTSKYISPELITGEYDSKCDMWAIGVIFYLMLYGEYPFDDETNDRQKIFYKIQNKEPHYSNTTVSKKANEFLKHLLNKDPSKRYDAETALKDEWLANEIKKEINLTIYNDIKVNKLQCIQPTKFISILQSFLIKEIDEEEIKNIKKQYYVLGDNTGVVNLQKYSSTMTPNMITDEGEEILTNKNINIDELFSDNGALKSKRKSGCEESTSFATMNHLDYTNFVIASLKSKNMLDEKVMKNVFNRFDMDKKGNITIEDISKALRRIGKKFSDEQIRKMLTESGFKNVEHIFFDEFNKVFNSYL